ncbi:DUF680 domain-containing protein [Mesorhizobium sp. B2-4-6]|uniref:DUF680 domain-containing protein n=1 Tax=Mesorhizobium sp. B2-4-6 TaxID=2589943 RepID=UPI00112DDD82|nr:DUF680 domain-containing protein [Mesorhizobium sp. B2-4-6]TPL47547.1 DUF680 domain-containing protein [Mesorhizobium sp. B2-4-6]
MTKIALAAAALLIAASTAFAGSDKFGSNDASQPAVTGTDKAPTASTSKSETTDQTPAVPRNSRDLFGNH